MTDTATTTPTRPESEPVHPADAAADKHAAADVDVHANHVDAASGTPSAPAAGTPAVDTAEPGTTSPVDGVHHVIRPALERPSIGPTAAPSSARGSDLLDDEDDRRPFIPYRKQVDLSPLMKRLRESAMELPAQSAHAALDAMRALLRWFLALIDRAARALGLNAQLPHPRELEAGAPDQKSFAQGGLGADNHDVVDLQTTTPGQTRADLDVSAEAVVNEAARVVAYLQDNPVPAELFAEAEAAGGANALFLFHANSLGQHHAAFAARQKQLEQAITERCSAIARTLGTTPAVIRAQLEAEHGAGVLYDRDETLIAMIEEANEIRVAMGRVGLVASSLLDSVVRTTSIDGEAAASLLARKLPGVPLQRPAAPAGAVAQASGEAAAGTGTRSLDRSQEIQSQVARQASDDASREGLSGESQFVAPSTTFAQTNIEFPAPVGLRRAEGSAARLQLIAGGAGESSSASGQSLQGGGEANVESGEAGPSDETVRHAMDSVLVSKVDPWARLKAASESFYDGHPEVDRLRADAP